MRTEDFKSLRFDFFQLFIIEKYNFDATRVVSDRNSVSAESIGRNHWYRYQFRSRNFFFSKISKIKQFGFRYRYRTETKIVVSVVH